MLAIDANILFYALNSASPDHLAAMRFLQEHESREDVAISEFTLVELYVLLRNPAILDRPLGESDAAAVVRAYRRHPRWRLLGFPPESQALHDAVWEMAGRPPFARRRIIDVRTAFTLLRQGVKEFATANVKDFEDLGFAHVWNPLLSV